LEIDPKSSLAYYRRAKSNRSKPNAGLKEFNNSISDLEESVEIMTQADYEPNDPKLQFRERVQKELKLLKDLAVIKKKQLP
jgi:hypothetical protein